MDAVRAYEEVIKDNIEYRYLIQDKNIDRGMLDEIVSLMLETVCTRRKVVRIAGDDYPAELVKFKFMKLNSSHIQFVIGNHLRGGSGTDHRRNRKIQAGMTP